MCFKHTEINGGSINFIEPFYYTSDKNDLKQNKIVIVYSLLKIIIYFLHSKYYFISNEII